jgi:ribonucleoside-triphosphate reductase (thioredoxin)
MSNYLPTDYQSFIATSRYARWIEAEKRRENWRETVERFIANVVKGKADPRTEDDILFAMLNLEVMPSMRSVMTAGPALTRDNTAGYNCSYLPVDDIKSFDEAMYILLCLYSGEIPTWDVSKVRPAGAKLKTFGGRASGPAPLVDLFNFAVS